MENEGVVANIRSAVTLLYHDVIENDLDESGFAGAAAGRYKIGRQHFKSHLASIAARVSSPAVAATRHALLPGARAFFFTVDDGGKSSLIIADELERLGWRGTFFITTGRTGTQGFMTAADIAALHRRGHSIGSHSVSHPYRMSELPDAAIAHEWRDSLAVLADIIGAPVETASVPGGFYSQKVAEAAASCGVNVLFNSEPVTSVYCVDGCLIVGRFNILPANSPAAVAAIAAGAPTALLKQQVLWNAKKTVKTYAAPVWDGARKLLFGS